MNPYPPFNPELPKKIDNLYKIFLSGSERLRFKEFIKDFDDINARIIKKDDGNLFVRVIIELTDEEVTLIKLAFSNDDCLILSGTEADMNKDLYANLIEQRFKPRV